MTTLNDLLKLEPIAGKSSGGCRLCSQQTTQGWSEVPSSKFSAWALLSEGTVFCPACWAALKHNKLRASSWVVTASGISHDTKDERFVWNAIINPPEPPFAIYFSKSLKKQGWLQLMQRVSIDRNAYWIGTDFLDKPFVAYRETSVELSKLIVELRQEKVSKTSMATGQYTAKQFEVAINNGYLASLNRAKRMAGYPLWEVLCYACK